MQVRNLKAFIFFAVLMSGGALTSACAQTMMIHVRLVPSGTVDPAAAATVSEEFSLLRATLEDGIMEQLFDAGMIVFSSEPKAAPSAGTTDANSSDENDTSRSDTSTQMQMLYRLQNEAKTGGASALLDVTFDVQVAESGNHARAVRAEFDLYSLSPRSVVTSGLADAGTYRASPKTTEESVSRSMGRAIAAKVLSAGSPTAGSPAARSLTATSPAAESPAASTPGDATPPGSTSRPGSPARSGGA